MKIAIQDVTDDPTTLYIGEAAIPYPLERQVLIRVNCAAVNRLDLLQSKGRYPVPPGDHPALGIEVSGTIAYKGEKCELDYEVNDSVMALVPGAGYSEFCLTDERLLIRCFPKLPMEIQAAIPEAFITAYQLCFTIAQVEAGETVLLHAAASSVGQAAIQMLVLKGATVFTTVRSEEKKKRCEEFGAVSINIRDSALFSEQIKKINDGNSIDIILDPVGTNYIEENLDIIGVDGRWVVYGMLSGSKVPENIFLPRLMMKRVSLFTTTLRGRTVEYKYKIIKALQDDPCGFPAIADGRIKVIIDRVFDLENVVEAHRYMQDNSNIGKIVLLVTSTANAVESLKAELKCVENRYLPPETLGEKSSG